MSSPLNRTRETSEIIQNFFGCPYEVCHCFTEINYGIWEGKSFEELEQNYLWKLHHSNRAGIGFPSGESLLEVQKRMVDGIFSLSGRFTGFNICIVSHNEPIKCLLAYFLGMPLDNLNKISIDTCSVSILRIDKLFSEIKGINIRDI